MLEQNTRVSNCVGTIFKSKYILIAYFLGKFFFDKYSLCVIPFRDL